MPNGYLRVQVMSAQDAVPISGAMVRIYKDIDKEIVHETFFITDDMGLTPFISLYAPSVELSLEERNQDRPYETYNVEIRANEYQTLEVVGVQIFADDYTNLPLNLIPNDVMTFRNTKRSVDYVQDHQLLTDAFEHSSKYYPPVPRLLGVVIIPKTITVHLGRPDSNAENINVDFIYYIKNVASSELYPTWEEECLKANILCQISLTLNRIYTEWYPSKGYPFDITNSTAYDQAFVKNRNIFDNISKIVDEMFNQYIQKDDFAEPFYAEYCDGKNSNCPGLKQWGSQALALSGYNYLEILKYYYGDNIRIVTSNNIMDIQMSFSGTPLRIGSSGLEVREIQEQLNAIAVNYPAITPIYPIDGVFKTSTEDAVKVFQRQFSLTPDGIVGKATWYKINYIYVAVRKLAELASLGDRNDIYNGRYPGTPLRINDRGVEVQILQYYLSVIALYDEDIKGINMIDGRFGQSTLNSVLSFQKKYHLTQDGIVGVITWNRIHNIFSEYEYALNNGYNGPVYPNIVLSLGASGEEVEKLQEALNIIGNIYMEFPILIIDGIFGSSMEAAVRRLQSIASLEVNGVVNEDTWKAIFTLANEIASGDAPSLGLPPFSSILTIGSQGEDVRLIQNRLQTISAYYSEIPSIIADGIFGSASAKAVTAFQRMMGLMESGNVDSETWYKINEVYRQLTT